MACYRYPKGCIAALVLVPSNTEGDWVWKHGDNQGQDNNVLVPNHIIVPHVCTNIGQIRKGRVWLRYIGVGRWISLVYTRQRGRWRALIGMHHPRLT